MEIIGLLNSYLNSAVVREIPEATEKLPAVACIEDVHGCALLDASSLTADGLVAVETSQRDSQ